MIQNNWGPEAMLFTTLLSYLCPAFPLFQATVKTVKEEMKKNFFMPLMFTTKILEPKGS